MSLFGRSGGREKCQDCSSDSWELGGVPYTVLPKMKFCFEDLRSKTFQWGKKGLWSKKRTKKGPVIELLRTFSRYLRKS